MVLVLESSRAKIDQSYFSIEKDSALSSLPIDGSRRRWNSATVGESLICIITEKDVFRLQISVDKIEIMQNYIVVSKAPTERWAKLTCYACEQLASKVLDLTVWEWDEGVALEEVKDTLSKKVHNDANVAAIIEAVSKVYTSIPVLRIVCFEGRQNPQFNPRSISVLLNGSDDLDSNQLVPPLVLGLDHFSKSSLA